METKVFGDKRLKIGTITKKDLKNLKDFQIFINSLVKEDAKILMNKKATLKDEKEFLDSALKSIKNKSKVFVIARDKNKIAGNTSIEIQSWRRNHIGKLGIAVAKDYRGIGLGNFLMKEVIKLAEKELNPKPKFIQMEVYANNKPAISLYKKMGFRVVAKIPEQIQYKGKLISEFIMIKHL